MVNTCESSSSSFSLDHRDILVGYRFEPTDEELICEYLGRKVRGLPQHTNVVVEMDVYAHEPWLLHNNNMGRDENEGYYFVKRSKKSASENGKTPNRGFKEGWWKATSGDISVKNEKGRIVGYKKTLKCLKYKDSKRNRKECIKTDWIMHEYRLPSESFQEWVVCRIKNLKRNKEDKEITEEQSGYVQQPLPKHHEQINSMIKGHGQSQVALTSQNGGSESVNLSFDPNLFLHQQELQCPHDLQQDIAPMSAEQESQGLLLDFNQVNDSCLELQGSTEQEHAEQEGLGALDDSSCTDTCLNLFTEQEHTEQEGLGALDDSSWTDTCSELFTEQEHTEREGLRALDDSSSTDTRLELFIAQELQDMAGNDDLWSF